ncbi:MAG TPA: di-heme-cytochrome C peroxidase [Bryobacteraceae bacterium]|nr:di-heme-cytochrome C peroxidase [Bryobacteraceae bacterium]
MLQSFFVYLFYKVGTNLHRNVFYGAGAIVVALVFSRSTWSDLAYYKIADNDADRGAVVVKNDPFGDRVEKIAYLKQNWSTADSLWFYNITQGSDLLPYDFFLVLEKSDSQELFRSDENINRYRYMPQKKTRSNPDGLPVGMVLDTYKGKKFMGFTCAACHCSQVNYNGVGIRIDGGPGAADMDTFMKDLAAAMSATKDNPAKLERFMKAVEEKGNYDSRDEIRKDLEAYTVRLHAYNFFNQTTAPYGYARLDAFGRIYNRVLEHVVNGESLRNVLKGAISNSEIDRLLAKVQPVLTSDNRDQLVSSLASMMSDDQQKRVRARLFNSPNAPVSYPFVWDIPQHDYVQWNGIGANAGVGPIGRNAGEVLGVFGTLDWAEKDGWTISSVLGGQGFGDKHISFTSSVNVHNLRKIESRLSTLESPSWKDAAEQGLLPRLDSSLVEKGELVFDEHCARCHAQIERSSPSRRIVAHMGKLADVKTDEAMAKNSVQYKGFSGILRNWYSQSGVGGILLDTRAPAAAILTTATENVVATPDPDKWFFTRGADWAVDLIDEFFSNEIKPSVKSGDYDPDTTAAPFGSLLAYKARALNGIWATAPYLHNGSVPTLYHLLLPADPQPGDPAGSEYRPKKFQVGSRELDVTNVGFRHGENEYQGFLFDTTQQANSNAGHEYGTRKMTPEQRRQLVEYLKSL